MRLLQNVYKVILFLGLIWVVPDLLLSQSEVPPDLGSDSSGLDTSIIYLIHADTTLWEIYEDSTIQTYNGNVIIYNDSTYMYCDSAYIKDSVYMKSYGDIVIHQGDSLQVFADTLIYSGETKLAELYGEVVLSSQNQKLYTNYLKYDVQSKIARYFTPSTLTDDSIYLTSKQGIFYVEDELAFFKDSVVVIGDNFKLKTDSLEYQTELKTVYFLGPTLIFQDSRKIYCESGYYDLENELASFTGNPQFEQEDQYAEADVIQYDRKQGIVELQGNAYSRDKSQEVFGDYIKYDEFNDHLYIRGNGIIIDSARTVYSDDIFYDVSRDSFVVMDRSAFYNEDQKLEADQVIFNNKSGKGVAWGEVNWTDTLNELGVFCDSLIYNNSGNEFTGIGRKKRPVLWTMMDQDTMYIGADTLQMLNQIDSGDTSRNLRAYFDVKIFKNDMQGIGDSLAYSEKDSVFTLFGDPLMWADTSQFSADTIDIHMKNDKLQKIVLKRNAFIINSPDEIFFNQIKGRMIEAFFRNDNLYLMKVNGNAETIYYVLDDENGYIGVNKSSCSNIKIRFGNNKVEHIISYKEIESRLFPMETADHSAMVLPGYDWQIDRKPKSKNDLEAKMPILD